MKSSKVLVLVGLIFALTVSSSAIAMVIVENGQPEATIVVKQNASDLQLVPANDLQEYIRKITGATLPIVDDTNAPTGNLILVGESTYTQAMGINTDNLPGDSFIIKTAPERLALAGHDATMDGSCAYNRAKKGTTNAVNAFLQDYCGVR